MNKENSTQAAANKAAEEGELDELLSRLAFARENEPPGGAREAKDSIRAYIAADRASRQDTDAQKLLAELTEAADVFMKGGVAPLRQKIDQAKLFCAGITEGSASRQVANKAEVEPVAHLKFWARQSWSGNGNHDVEHAEGLEVCEAGEIGDDGEPAFPVYAIPPATTGASTTREEVLDEVINALTKRFVVKDEPWVAIGIVRALKGSVGASTALTDERIGEIATETCDEEDSSGFKFCSSGRYSVISFARAIEREVAAQAGQVAVIGLSEEQTDRIARNYFSEQWAVQHAKDAIHDALTEAGAAGQVAVLGKSEARYQWFRDWLLRGGARFEIDPWGHVRVTTAQMVDEAIDAALATPSPAKESK